MVDSSSDPPLDLEALACAFEQLELAAGSLARAVHGRPGRDHEGWELVQSADAAPAGASEQPEPSFAPRVDSSAPPSFRFRPEPSTDPKPSTLPSECLFLCSSLAPAARQSRASRAWAAGLSAGKKLRGEADCVEPTPEVPVKNRCYLVLRGPAGKPARFFRNFGDFKLYVGRLSGETICHGWPTEGEARVYCRAAGLAFPEP